MKTNLIILPEQHILVSDEEIKEGDLYIDDTDTTRTSITSDKDYWSVRRDYKKIIAGVEDLPSIDWNGLEEEFGIVDVEKLAKEEFKQDGSLEAGFLAGSFKQGFKKSQSLNEKKFSLEEINQCWLQAQRKMSEPKTGKGFTSFIQSLQQPKVFDVEIETEQVNKFRQPVSIEDLDYPEFTGEYNFEHRPKITNNSIKILKKCGLLTTKFN